MTKRSPATSRRKAASGITAPPRPNPTRSRAITPVLKREGSEAASHEAISRQVRSAARQRGPANLKAAAEKAVRTKGPAERSAAARKAAQTRARQAR